MAKSNSSATKLLQAMKKLVREVNDQEICRRLEILINSEKEDIPQPLIKKIFEAPEEIEPRLIQEPYTQYVMHYLYMLKREQREQEKLAAQGGEPAAVATSGGSRSRVSKRVGAASSGSSNKKRTRKKSTKK